MSSIHLSSARPGAAADRTIRVAAAPPILQDRAVTDHRPTVSRLALVSAFAAIYVIWGSTYLAIRIGIETVPPFPLAGVRFVVAGALLYGLLRWRGVAAPTRREWRSGAIVGALLMFGGNGLVTQAEKFVDSGLAAVLVAIMPLWMVVLDATIYRGSRPSAGAWIGLGLGVLGVVVLVDPTGGAVDPVGAAILVLATFCWANGSLLNRHLEMPASPWMSAAAAMLTGGLLTLAVAVATGQAAELDLAAVSGRSFAAFVYLTVFGSIVALSAYVYLLRVTTAAAVSTYAFVNPVIALALGWAFGEQLGPRAVVGAALVVGAVVLIHRVRVADAAGSDAAPAPVDEAGSPEAISAADEPTAIAPEAALPASRCA